MEEAKFTWEVFTSIGAGLLAILSLCFNWYQQGVNREHKERLQWLERGNTVHSRLLDERVEAYKRIWPEFIRFRDTIREVNSYELLTNLSLNFQSTYQREQIFLPAIIIGKLEALSTEISTLRITEGKTNLPFEVDVKEVSGAKSRIKILLEDLIDSIHTDLSRIDNYAAK